MRIRDATRNNRKRGVASSLTFAARARASLASNSLTALFLRIGIQHEKDVGLCEERKRRIASVQFNLANVDDKVCLERYRFTKTDLYRIANTMYWPISYNTTKRRRYRTSCLFSLCVLTRRLGTVCRWCDLEEEFGMSSGCLSEIFYEALDHVFESYGHLLHSFRVDLFQQRVGRYAEAIYEKGGVLDSCFGFIDCTNVFIARPSGVLQRATYNGHKRRNCVKMQSVTSPDGLVFHMFGPMEGRRHDITLFRKSGLEDVLEAEFEVEGRQFYLFGDPAYVLRAYMQKAFEGAALSEAQRAFNKAMAECRTAVEWGFKDIRKYFTHVDMPRKMGIRKVPVARLLYVSAFLWNLRACLYGSQTATFFDCAPPTLEEYLGVA